MNVRRTLFLIAFLFIALLPASAQRMISGQWQASLGGMPWMAPGGELAMSTFGYEGKAVFRAVCMGSKDDYVHLFSRTVDTSDGFETVSAREEVFTRSIDAYLSFGYSWPVARNRSRSAVLWAGISIDSGIRARTAMEKMSDGVQIPGVDYLYGFSPELDFEFFLSDSFSSSVFFRPHVQWYSRAGKDGNGDKLFKDDPVEKWFFPEVGVRFNLCMFLKP